MLMALVVAIMLSSPGTTTIMESRFKKNRIIGLAGEADQRLFGVVISDPSHALRKHLKDDIAYLMLT